MTTELMDEWIAALLSGRYAQGKHKLRKSTPEGPTFCCMGVLAEVLVEKGAAIRDGDGYEYLASGKHLATMMPVEVLDVFVCTNLITMNDRQDKTFKEIASYLDGLPCENP